MRHDMFKVIVERPRAGGKDGQANEFRRAKHFILDEELDVADEFCTNKISTRPRRKERKVLNENLSPLRRFLHKQVGRPWDSVYSEICQQLDADSTVKQHVRDHIQDFVNIKVIRQNDVLVSIDSYSWSTIYPGELYVDPETKVLKKFPGARARWNYSTPVDPNVKIISKYLRFIKTNATWFKVKFEDLDVTQSALHYSFWTDALGTYADGCYRKYGHKIKAVSKETASKKDIRDYKLNAS